MLVVALTGGIGAGKSTVAQFFAQLGALVIDADQLARLAIERGTDGFAEVMMRFGDEVIINGDIDRRKLAEIVFFRLQGPSRFRRNYPSQGPGALCRSCC